MEIEDEKITVGNFTLTRFPQIHDEQPQSYWLEHESGEGMQVWADQMEIMIKELWKEF